MRDHPRFGYMLDLILALRMHGVPLDALNLNFFIEQERAWIRAGYEAKPSELLTLKESADA